MSKKSDINLQFIYEGDAFQDLPLTLHFLKNMSPEDDIVESGNIENAENNPDENNTILGERKNKQNNSNKKVEKSLKGVTCTFQRSKMYICTEFYRPISKLIYPPKNESKIN